MAEEEKKKEGEQKVGGLSDEEIMLLDTTARASACAKCINEVLVRHNCIFNPIAHISNGGYHLEVNVLALAYVAKGPGLVGNPLDN